jgi:hypothetical protein
VIRLATSTELRKPVSDLFAKRSTQLICDGYVFLVAFNGLCHAEPEEAFESSKLLAWNGSQGWAAGPIFAFVTKTTVHWDTRASENPLPQAARKHRSLLSMTMMTLRNSRH